MARDNTGPLIKWKESNGIKLLQNRNIKAVFVHEIDYITIQNIFLPIKSMHFNIVIAVGAFTEL